MITKLVFFAECGLQCVRGSVHTYLGVREQGPIGLAAFIQESTRHATLADGRLHLSTHAEPV